MTDNENPGFKGEENSRGGDGVRRGERKSALERLPGWYKASLILLAALPFSLMLGPIVLAVGLTLLAALAGTFTLGVKSLDEIRHSNGTLLSNGYPIPAIVTSLAIVLSLVVTYAAISSGVIGFMLEPGSYRMSQIGYALEDYASEHQGQLPEAERWCDALNDSGVVDEWVFPRVGNGEHTCDFALNREAVRVGADASGNMVLLFPSEPGWNQVGGIELLRKSRSGRVSILFADMHSETFREKNVPYLRWKLEVSGDIPEPDIAKQLGVAGVIVGIVFVWIVVQMRGYARKYWFFALVLGVLSAGAGMLLGAAAEGILYVVGHDRGMGMIAGGIAGFLVGVCYLLVLGRFAENRRPEVSCLGYATVSGSVTGAICSIIVHALLMICYEESSFINMMAGLGFGVMAGILLGWISSGIIEICYSKRSVTRTAEGMEIC